MLTPEQIDAIRRRLLLDPADDMNTFDRHVNEDVPELLAEIKRLQDGLTAAQNLADVREKLLHEAWSAHHSTLNERDTVLAKLTEAEAARDDARGIAVALEQENAQLREQVSRWNTAERLIEKAYRKDYDPDIYELAEIFGLTDKG